MGGLKLDDTERILPGAAIDCYFGTRKGQQLVKHQLDSYQDFVSRKLPQIVRPCHVLNWHELA